MLHLVPYEIIFDEYIHMILVITCSHIGNTTTESKIKKQVNILVREIQISLLTRNSRSEVKVKR